MARSSRDTGAGGADCAEGLGIAGLLEQQLQQSQADRYSWALGQFPMLAPKAYRWVPEMLEIDLQDLGCCRRHSGNVSGGG
jgi:hypothetical protein